MFSAPTNQTLYDLLGDSARLHPTSPAIISSGEVITFSDLEARTHTLAAELKSLNIPPGATVGVCVHSAADFLASLFSLFRNDLVVLSIPPELGVRERERLASETQVFAIIGTADSFSDTLGISHTKPLPLALEIATLTPSPPCWVSDNYPSASVVRYTSGTTGRSKGVVLSKEAVLARTEASITLLDLRAGDVVLLPLSLSYHFVASALSIMRAGAALIDCVGCTGSEMYELCMKHRASHIYASPVQLELMALAANSPQPLSVRKTISTSTLLPARIAELVKSNLKVEITTVYGIIEVGLPIWNHTYNPKKAVLGKCLPPYSHRVIGSDGASIAASNQVGELQLSGPGLFSGYIGTNDGAIHRSSFEWFPTGDLVSYDEAQQIVYRGRIKNVINSGGYKIYPEELESIILSFPAIEQVNISSRSDDSLGEVPVAELVVKAGHTVDLDSLRIFCARELSPHEIPREFSVVESLPMTGSGKVKKY